MGLGNLRCPCRRGQNENGAAEGPSVKVEDWAKFRHRTNNEVRKIVFMYIAREFRHESVHGREMTKDQTMRRHWLLRISF